MVDMPHGDGVSHSILLFAEIGYRYAQDDRQLYVVPVTVAEGERAAAILKDYGHLVIGKYHNAETDTHGVYHEAIIDPAFGQAMLQCLLDHKRILGLHGIITGETVRPVTPDMRDNLPAPAFLGLEQSNTSLKFDKEYFFKLFRKLEEGENPEIEIGRHLAHTGFTASPTMIGNLKYQNGGKFYSLGVLHGYVESSGTAWDLLQKHLAVFTGDALTQDVSKVEDSNSASQILAQCPSFFDLDVATLPSWFVQATAATASLVKRLGQRTGEMHLALTDYDRDNAFQPEEFTPFYQRSLYQSMRNRAGAIHTQLQQAALADADVATLQQEVLAQWGALDREFERLRQGAPLAGQRIRTHGDYHLGQIVVKQTPDGADFSILDFEGEPMRSLSTRRLKHSPLVDVAGLLRSFDYAICFYERNNIEAGTVAARSEAWLHLWRNWMCRQFMDGYLAACGDSGMLPKDEIQLRYLTKLFLLQKALYEVGYELSNRPDWVKIPLRGILDLLAMLRQPPPVAGVL